MNTQRTVIYQQRREILQGANLKAAVMDMAEDLVEDLLLLARNHAGINLALGYADAEPIGPGQTTFEVRAFDPVANRDLAVTTCIHIILPTNEKETA